MISTFIFGGLGNQLFQFAAAYAHAIRKGERLVIPEPMRYPPHDNPSQLAISQILRLSGGDGDLELGSHILPRGYYQDAAYFVGQEDDVLRALAPIHPRRRVAGEIAIHVRMGDYLHLQDIHPVISEDYIRAAVKHQLSVGAVPAIRLFSDSPDVAMRHVQSAVAGIDITITPADYPLNSVTQLIELAGYDHMICSNSTYSWWAAWLHRAVSHQAFVVMPSQWFGESGQPEWRQIYRGVSKGFVTVL